MENLAFVQEVIALTNQFRAANGVAPLSVDIELTAAAQQHSQNMALQDFFSHTGLDGSTPRDRALAAGYEMGGAMGENISAGRRTPTAVVNGWINSPGHRANMLSSSYNEIGVGYYFLANDTGSENWGSYWTQVFGQGEIEAPAIDPLQYSASHRDLIGAFGVNPDALVQHYATYGQLEGRATDTFDELNYLASYDDLIAAFGFDLQAATVHYIQYGAAEGRTPQFDAAAYLANYSDLQGAFGSDLNAATQHYIQHGFYEGRSWA